MAQNLGQASRFAFLPSVSFIFLLFLIPIFLSGHPASAAATFLVFTFVFFFPGYLLLTLLSNLQIALKILLSPIVGIVGITTVYDIFTRAAIGIHFFYILAALSLAGIVLFAGRSLHTQTWTQWSQQTSETALAGWVSALAIAPLFWRSGRFANGELIFHGPAGQDHLYHLTLLQRLLLHVPPDNFIVSGLRPPVYHYFDDLTLALIVRAQSALHLGATDLFDLYYRCYPGVVYFLIGALAYRTGRQLLGSAKGGILSLLLLLGGGGLGWLFGILHTAAHITQFAAMRASLFSDWTAWDGINSIVPLAHRPAHYHSLLICLAALNVLLRPERSRGDWILAGLLLGLMAGFNLTLAATFGVAAVLGAFILLLQQRQYDARDLAWFASFILIGSLPVNVGMFRAGFHNTAPGFPFSGPNLQFPVAAWGSLLDRILPTALVPWVALIMFPIFAYGIKLSGAGAMARLDLGEARHRTVAMVFALAFSLSFVIGTFFPYQAFGGVGIVFLQPTLWILGLFSLRPIYAWLERGRENWRAVVLCGILGLTWVQALAAFNFSNKISFDRETAQALQDIRATAAPDDVVAYLPSELIAIPIWGPPQESTNFAVTALTDLDGYFSSETYSKFFAVPGLSGHSSEDVLAQAEALYAQRRGDIESFIRGDMGDAAAARLAKDHVRWIVVSGRASQSVSSSAAAWRKTDEIAVYRFAR
jgi:hypothetical protein